MKTSILPDRPETRPRQVRRRSGVRAPVSAAQSAWLAAGMLFALAASPARAQQAQTFDSTWDDAYSGKGVQTPAPRSEARNGRVRFVEGDLKLDRYEDERSESATVNAPIFEGDSASTATGARAEIQLASGAIVSLDERSKATFLALADPAGSGDQETVLQLSSGSMEVEVHRLGNRDGDFRIDTVAASVYILSSGRYRIDIEGSYGQTRVSCYRGVAEVAGDDGSVMLRSGQRTFLERAGEPEDPRAFNTAASDSFDGWVVDRTGGYAVEDNSDELDLSALNGDQAIPDAVQPYRNELSYYGSWVTIAPYGPCWIPGGVSAGWRPYYNGYWAYGPAGSFWVSSDPWGWAPYHYGRWSWASGYGWFWSPGAVFSGAWVSWYYGPAYIGWAPLGYWNYPCAYAPGYVGIDYRCWNFVNYTNVYVHNPRPVYVRPFLVRNEVARGNGVVVNHPVRLSPHDLRDNPATPDYAVRRAREIAQSEPAPSAAAANRRSFREQEREIVRAAPRSNVRGAGALRTGEGSRGTQPLQPAAAGSQPAGGEQAQRPHAHGRSEFGPAPSARTGSPSGSEIRAHSSSRGNGASSSSGGGSRQRTLNQTYGGSRPEVTQETATPSVPHRHPPSGAAAGSAFQDQPDRHLREFFNSADPVSRPQDSQDTDGSPSRARAGSSQGGNSSDASSPRQGSRGADRSGSGRSSDASQGSGGANQGSGGNSQGSGASSGSNQSSGSGRSSGSSNQSGGSNSGSGSSSGSTQGAGSNHGSGSSPSAPRPSSGQSDSSRGNAGSGGHANGSAKIKPNR